MVEAKLCWRLATWLPGGPCEEDEYSENATPDTIQETGMLNRVAESLPCKERKNREKEREGDKGRGCSQSQNTKSPSQVGFGLLWLC